MLNFLETCPPLSEKCPFSLDKSCGKTFLRVKRSHAFNPLLSCITFQLERTALAELLQSRRVLFQHGESDTLACGWYPSLVHILNHRTPSSARTLHARLTWEEMRHEDWSLSQHTLTACITHSALTSPADGQMDSVFCKADAQNVIY